MNLNISEKLSRFISLLEGIFELDKADLDFGIYRILNIRKDEIKQFLSTGLPKKVQEALAPFAPDTATITKRIGEIEKQADDLGIEITASPKLAEEYSRLKSQLASGTDLSSLETDVYSALYSFFNRYYDEGDFISKRRYKEGVYAIPYEGEEVKLHWANADQYYIKTTENFRDYTFVDDGKKIHFRLVDATTEKNNNKESDTSKRVFMLYTETPEKPELKTIEEINGELVIRFVYDVPADKRKASQYAEENFATIKDAIQKTYKDWYHVLAEAPTAKNGGRTIIQKHLEAYVAKNTFDYFIHKNLRVFLTRELDFFIKSEVIHLDDLDTTDEKRADGYLAKVRAIKRVGKIIIDFLSQIEDFQKKLWLKKKFVVSTNWCITLDRIDEAFYPEIIANAAQIAEWKEMYAIDEIERNLTTAGYSEPLTADFLRQNGNLVLDTRHFAADFKDRLIASIDNLDEQTGGLLIHSENFQALQLLMGKYRGQIEHIHIDPPYNTVTSGFLYKNSYQHSSWASMMFDRMKIADTLLQDENGTFQCHIDENEYELLFMLFGLMPRNNAGTIIWNKLNPMLGRKGVATQHEYVIFKSNFNNSIYAKSENLDKLKEYAAKAIQDNNGVNDIARAVYKQMLNDDDTLTGGECAYNLIDDDRNIYRLVAMGAPEKRLDEKYYIPLIHPITKKPCPVPSNGWSRRPETMADMIAAGRIVFGKDETTQPQKKVVLSEESTKQIASVISDGKSGKAFLDSLGTEFPYAHPVSLYEVLISANNPTLILDYFAGSGTTGHAVLNLNRADNGTRKYILVEMAEYFHTVTLPRMKKVVYSADWKAGKPQNRGTGVSHIMKYVVLESYEDALSNIELDDERHTLFSHFGEEYLLHYMFDYEAKDSMLSLSAFNSPFKYRLRINENNETKDKVVDICETFNFLLGLSVIRQSAAIRFRAVADPNGGYEGAVKLEIDDNGEYVFKHIEGRTPDGKRALVIWRTLTQDLLQSNAALDAYFGKHRINPADREFDMIYVNGDNNLENLRLDDETWKVQRIEPVFKEKMLEEAE